MPKKCFQSKCCIVSRRGKRAKKCHGIELSDRHCRVWLQLCIRFPPLYFHLFSPLSPLSFFPLPLFLLPLSLSNLRSDWWPREERGRENTQQRGKERACFSFCDIFHISSPPSSSFPDGPPLALHWSFPALFLPCAAVVLLTLLHTHAHTSAVYVLRNLFFAHLLLRSSFWGYFLRFFVCAWEGRN